MTTRAIAVLNSLESVHIVRGDSRKARIGVVKSGTNDCAGNGLAIIIIKAGTDATESSNVEVRYCADV